jgi:hypothetical protein
MVLIRLQETKSYSPKEEREAEYRKRAELALYLSTDKGLETAAEKATKFAQLTSLQAREYYRSLKWAEKHGMLAPATAPVEAGNAA